MAGIFLLVVFCLVLIVSDVKGVQLEFKLPPPTGPFVTGATEFEFLDEKCPSYRPPDAEWQTSDGTNLASGLSPHGPQG